ncbi:MAG: hypothetical protein P4K80_08440 [Acidobacteriaceae bacterium]|nr:hypothetical protein [Acidobacteriaceae bacterium]
MANEEPTRWEQQLREAAVRVEEDLRRVVTYINNEVVPEVRLSGSQALRTAANELMKLAQRMDDRRTAPHQQPTPPSTEEPNPAPDKDKPQP